MSYNNFKLTWRILLIFLNLILISITIQTTVEVWCGVLTKYLPYWFSVICELPFVVLLVFFFIELVDQFKTLYK